MVRTSSSNSACSCGALKTLFSIFHLTVVAATRCNRKRSASFLRFDVSAVVFFSSSVTTDALFITMNRPAVSGRLRHSHVWRTSPLCKSECATPTVSLRALDYLCRKNCFGGIESGRKTDFPFLSRLTISPSISAGLERLALSTRRTTSDQN